MPALHVTEGGTTLKRVLGIILAAAIAAPSHAADPVEIVVSSVWTGLQSGNLRQPLLVTVRNNTSQDARGALEATNSADAITVPLELAKGTTKSVPLYLLPGDVTTDFVFRSDIGNYRVTLPNTVGFSQFRIGMIADHAGELQFLQSRRDAAGNWIQDETLSIGYCRAEDAPDRMVGYFLLDALFLGEGAERLREPQVQAIKQYVLQGGRVVISGGANVPQLTDPKWANVLPVRNAAPATLSSLEVTLSGGGQHRVDESLTVMTGDPAPGTLVPTRGGGRGLAYLRPVGMGSVILLAYNPFEAPVRDHPQRRQILMDALKAARFGSKSTEILGMTMPEDRGEWDYSRAPMMSPSNGARKVIYEHDKPIPSARQLTEGPFNYRPLPARTIGWILLGFFIAVVPLNFLVLRIVRRMELAWVTTPILTAGCALVLMSSAQGLYQFDRARAIYGVVYQDNDAGMAGEWLKASWFFPRGGAYELTIPGTDQVLDADRIGPNDMYGYMGYRNQGVNTLPTMDIRDGGHVEMPSVGVGNLGFLEFVLNRPTVEPLKVDLKLHRDGNGLRGSVRNESAFRLLRPAIVSGRRSYSLPDLEPGQSFTFGPSTKWVYSSPPLISSGRREGQAVLYAYISGYAPQGERSGSGNLGQVLAVVCQTVGGAP